jgi:hypothetical protein
MKHILALTLLLSGVAHAQAWNENILNWEVPTGCTDGTPITNCPVTGYQVETAATATATNWVHAGTSVTTTFTHRNVSAGPHCYRVRANSDGGSSGYTNVVCKTNVAPPPPVPNPPTNLRFVTVSATNHPDTDWTPAFRISGNTAGTMLALVPVGRQTQSEPLFTYRGKPHCRVEVGQKELTGTTDARNLVAPCGPS